MQMAEMGSKIARDMAAANGAQACAEAQASAAADKAKLEHRLAQLSAEVTPLNSPKNLMMQIACSDIADSSIASCGRDTHQALWLSQHASSQLPLQCGASLSHDICKQRWSLRTFPQMRSMWDPLN